MKRKEFDLSEYSLEVRDGKAVLERKEKEPQGFKPGDILSHPAGIVAIYADTDKFGVIVTYAWYTSGIFNDTKGGGWDYTKAYSYATEEQKAILFAEIEKRGYVWDAEKLELRKREFEDGAFLVDELGNMYIYCREACVDGMFGFYAAWYPGLDDGMILEKCYKPECKMSYAKEKQKSMFLSKLLERGLEWDSDNKKLRVKRWRAEKGEMYWHAEFGQDVTRAFPSVEMGREVDDFRYENGNYYSTKGEILRDIEEVEQRKRKQS